MNLAAGTRHMRCVRGVPGQFKGDVGLNCGVEFCRTSGVNVPSTVRELPATNVIGQLDAPVAVQLSQNMKEEDVIRLQRRVGFKFSYPVAFRGL